MTKYKFRDENNNWISLVQDINLNGVSVFDGIKADINIKTINNESLIGTGNIDIQSGGSGEYVEYTANQGLTTQQQLNARNNISALGFVDIKQGTGDSTTNVISQKGVTDLLATKQNAVPNGTNPLISLDTGKLDLVYMPATVLGGITNGGTFNGSGIITASSYAPKLQGEKIDEVQFAAYPSYYFICADDYSFAGFDFTVGDWAISLGNGWAKLNATDAVTSVNGKMGQVVLNAEDVQATPLWFGIDKANKNLVTDYLGMVTTSDYALGQIIVDYYNELPTNVPLTAKASVINGSSYVENYTDREIQDSLEYGTIYSDFVIVENPTRPTGTDSWVTIENPDGTLDFGYAMSGGVIEPTFNLNFTDEYGNSHECYYSYIEQEYANPVSETLYLNVGWNEVKYDDNTGEPYIVQMQYSDIPILTGIFFTGYQDNDTGFINSFGKTAYHLAGEYIYSQEEPVTDPPVYYWKYNPSNVQSDLAENDPSALSYVRNRTVLRGDMSEDDPNALTYISNRATLRTDITSILTPGTETIKGQIRLHKITKTADYGDLKNQVGIKDSSNSGGEIFGSYSGTDMNKATGACSAAFGSKSEATAHSAFVEGSQNHATGTSSHAEGNSTVANNTGAHSEGQFTNARGNSSHAEGAYSIASGLASHTEGYHTEANKDYAHSEGYYSLASGEKSHAEGYGGVASGEGSHAQNINTVASGKASHSEGDGTKAQSACQHAQGKFNVGDAQDRYAHIVGNGTADNARSNAHTLDWNGNAWFKGDIRVGGTSYDTGTPVGGNVLPSQTGHAGEFLTTDGTDASWGVATTVIMRVW